MIIYHVLEKFNLLVAMIISCMSLVINGINFFHIFKRLYENINTFFKSVWCHLQVENCTFLLLMYM